MEESFINFRLILNDFIKVFSKYSQKIGPADETWLTTEKVYHKLDRWDPKEYERLANIFDYQVDLVEDLMLELTRAANKTCDEIRKAILKSFRLEEGVLLVTAGPFMDLSYKTYRVEYKNQEKWNYVGLKDFMETRKERELHYGEGVSDDYFNIFFDDK